MRQQVPIWRSFYRFLNKAYLQERLIAGQHNVKQLVAELREQGYRQGETIVYDYVRRMREQPQWQQAVRDAKKRPHLASGQLLSAREAAWLFVCHPRKLRFAQAVKLDDVRRLDEVMETAYQLARDFRVMVTTQQESVLKRWLMEARGVASTNSAVSPQVSSVTLIQFEPPLPWPTAMGRQKGK